jgi:uncharacterized LabA/DUF88 family protein
MDNLQTRMKRIFKKQTIFFDNCRNQRCEKRRLALWQMRKRNSNAWRRNPARFVAYPGDMSDLSGLSDDVTTGTVAGASSSERGIAIATEFARSLLTTASPFPQVAPGTPLPALFAPIAPGTPLPALFAPAAPNTPPSPLVLSAPAAGSASSASRPKRVGVFVDGGHLRHSLKFFFKESTYTVDYDTVFYIIDQLEEGAEIVTRQIHDVFDLPDLNHKDPRVKRLVRYATFLRDTRKFVVPEYWFKWNGTKKVQSGVDAGLATKIALSMRRNLDKIILIAGDGDFVSSIKMIREDYPEVEIEVISFGTRASNLLMQEADVSRKTKCIEDIAVKWNDLIKRF